MNLLKKIENEGVNIEGNNNIVTIITKTEDNNDVTAIVPFTSPELGVKKEYIQSLEKIEFISSTHELNLSGTFVWPDFKVNNVSSSKNDEDIKGSFESLINSDNKYSFIVGSELSGKTSIGKKLFLEAKQNGYNAVFINGESITINSNFDKLLKKELTEQYEGKMEEFLNLDKKILIIDNFNRNISSKIIGWAEKNFVNIVALVGNDEHMLYFGNNQNYIKFNVYSIKTFTSSKQHELIVKWKNGGSDNVEDSIFNKGFDVIENRINDIITKYHIVPKIPFYILTIIQNFDNYTQSDLNITSYGHCYKVLLISQLGKKDINYEEYGDCLNYLKDLAYYIFKNGKNCSISLAEYGKFKTEYNEKFIEINKIIIKKIEDKDYPILKIDENVKFEFPYIYYYFVGQYIAEKETVEHIEELCNTIYRKDSSHILIFTIHHATNHKLLDKIQHHCKATFDGRSETRLTTDETMFMNDVLKVLKNDIISDKTVSENRIEEKKRIDQIEKDNPETDNDFDENKDKNLQELKKSLKIIEVLGQILKNRAGTIEKAKVQDLLLEVEKLGLRLLSYFLESIKSEGTRNLIESKLNLVEESGNNHHQNRKLDGKEKAEFIEHIVQMFATSAIYGILVKIYQSVSVEKLLSLQNQITKDNNYPAYELINILFKINYNSIKIDEIKALHNKFNDDGNIWAQRALSHFLQMYINAHDVEFNIKQQICSIIGVKYSQKKNLIAVKKNK